MTPDCPAVSGYSKEGIKWTYNLPSQGGLPVQYGPHSDFGWYSVAYGNTANGPLFVAVSNCFDNDGHNPGGTYYVNGQITTVDNYASVATSTDGINWTTGTGLPYGYWYITYDPVSQYFQAVGGMVNNQAGAQSIDGVNWQMNVVNILIRDMCYGTQGVVAVGNTTQILPSYTTIWNLSSNMPLNESINSVKFLQGAYYATGKYGLYESIDGINWTNLNVTDVNANTLFAGMSTGDIDYFNGCFILHMYMYNRTGQFYYSQYATGPYSFSNYINIALDNFDINLSSNQNIIFGLGNLFGAIQNVAWSTDGINWYWT